MEGNLKKFSLRIFCKAGLCLRLKKEQKRLEGELARVNGMLSNERFMSKAPEAKVLEERAKLEKYTQMMEQVEERLTQLGAR